MGVAITRYIRKPLYVDAVRVTPQNIEELAEWCDGKIDMGYPNPNQTGKKKKYIKVNVLNPRNPRQTMAFIGDWLLRQGDSFKIYTFKAFQLAFDPADDENAESQSEQMPKFYLDPETNDITEAKPGKHAQPLSLQEIADIVRNEVVVTYERPNVVKEEPLPPQPRNVGSNIEIQDKRDHGAATGADPEFEGVPMAQPGSSLVDAPPPGGDMFPPESPEMKEARETIEADGGTVETASPEAISNAVKENEQARAATELAEEGIAEMVEEQQPVELPPPDEIVPDAPVVEEVPDSEGITVESSPTSPPVDPAAGKRVLSEHEQRILGPDEVRAMVRSGDVILAQDLEPAEQS